jgi:hypothetical protein
MASVIRSGIRFLLGVGGGGGGGGRCNIGTPQEKDIV